MNWLYPISMSGNCRASGPLFLTYLSSTFDNSMSPYSTLYALALIIVLRQKREICCLSMPKKFVCRPAGFSYFQWWWEEGATSPSDIFESSVPFDVTALPIMYLRLASGNIKQGTSQLVAQGLIVSCTSTVLSVCALEHHPITSFKRPR